MMMIMLGTLHSPSPTISVQGKPDDRVDVTEACFQRTTLAGE